MTVKDYLSGRVHGNNALEPSDSVCKYMLGENAYIAVYSTVLMEMLISFQHRQHYKRKEEKCIL